jgi:hypothetical protein
MTCSEAFFPVHRMELNFCHLHDDVVHIFEAGREITVVLNLDMMSQIDSVLHHTSTVITIELIMLMVAFNTGLNRKISLSNANLSTFTGYTVCIHPVSSRLGHALQAKGNWKSSMGAEEQQKMDNLWVEQPSQVD